MSRFLDRPLDISALAAFRMMLGGLMFASSVRFLANGWVDRFFGVPRYFFHYWGFDWIPIPSVTTMTVVHIGMAVAALGVAIGLFYRWSAIIFVVLFSYIELVDLSNYLNHYYLVTLLSLLLCVLPAHRAYSLDVLRKPHLRVETIPAWMVYLLRFQVGVVYVFAGLAKCQPDWLLSGQPLGIWLAARTDVPLLGSLFAIPETALLMSWAGFLFDTTIPFWLAWRRTRRVAFLVVLLFHGATHLMFTIGVFPFLMTIAATLFFDPDWPRWVVGKFRATAPGDAATPRVSRKLFLNPSALGTMGGPRLSRLIAAGLVLWCAAQVVLPLRTHLYGGDVLWHEQGMRYSWRVMVREKNGSVSYRVRARDWPRERVVTPRAYLTAHQEREMSGQPDMILQLALHIADDLREQGLEDVEVRVDALVSLNGRLATRIIDPDVDLTKVRDGLGRADWILPAPSEAPLQIAVR